MTITKVQREMYYHVAGQTLGPSNIHFPIYTNHMDDGIPGQERLYASGFMCPLLWKLHLSVLKRGPNTSVCICQHRCIRNIC